MTSSFFSNPEDELTVEEIKSLGKLIPKIPGPKNWDSKFAPGRGEGRAAFAKSKRNLDAMMERDAFRVKNKGNVALGLDGKPMRPANYLAPTREDILNEGSEKSANEAIKDATNLIKKKESGNLGGGSSIGETNARASWLKATANSPAAKAGFSDDERWNLQQKHREWKAARSNSVEQTEEALEGSNTSSTYIPPIPDKKDSNTPQQPQPPINKQPPNNQQPEKTKLTAAERMEAGAQAMAKEFIVQMAKKLTEGKEGDEGADRSGGALSGDKAWEKFYTGNEFASLPAWYM